MSTAPEAYVTSSDTVVCHDRWNRTGRCSDHAAEGCNSALFEGRSESVCAGTASVALVRVLLTKTKEFSVFADPLPSVMSSWTTNAFCCFVQI